ncbi:predicted protein [Nematostella vectensis]|uniref:G-protein coupled receptors family 1 profile domain-containing protein n=1 Tax=Nematostella vectensis TaxID=45351 RepID=A7S575_NEMVE|nr:predicted protein [Nematostella vectensis]|eukprot:XP_001633258.1 predicted protein [Nematostella vectensis]
MNLVVISVERYMAIFYPLRAPSRAYAKKQVIAAWIVGGTLAAILNLPMKHKYIEVIIAFCIPYSAFFLYNLVKRFANLKLSYELDYTVRMLTGALAISNSALNPIIYFTSSRVFRSHLKDIVFPGQDVSTNATQSPGSSKLTYIAGGQEGADGMTGLSSKRKLGKGFVLEKYCQKAIGNRGKV